MAINDAMPQAPAAQFSTLQSIGPRLRTLAPLAVWLVI
jgi:hypothetical protein